MNRRFILASLITLMLVAITSCTYAANWKEVCYNDAGKFYLDLDSVSGSEESSIKCWVQTVMSNQILQQLVEFDVQRQIVRRLYTVVRNLNGNVVTQGDDITGWEKNIPDSPGDFILKKAISVAKLKNSFLGNFINPW